MTYQPHPIIRLKSYISQPQLFSTSVQFATAMTLFSSLHQLGYNFSTISTSFLKKRSSICHWAVANQTGMLEHKPIEKRLTDQRLSDLVVVEQEGLTETLQKKATGKEPWLVARETVSWTQQVWLLRYQYQL